MAKVKLYQKIIDDIMQKIRFGELQAGQQIPTEAELLDKYEVSRATVLKALGELTGMGVIYRVAGRGSFVAEPDRAVRKEKSRKTISFITPFSSNGKKSTFELEVIRGIEKHLRGKGYFLSVHGTDNDPEIEKAVIKECISEEVDGIILYSAMASDSYMLLNKLKINDYPIVTIDWKIDELDIKCVQSDNIKAGYEGTRYLISKGYEDIYFVSDIKVQMISSVRDRYTGYCKALKEARKPIQEEFCINNFAVYENNVVKSYGYDTKPDLYDKFIKYIAKTSSGKKIGIFAVNDYFALSFLKAVCQFGFKVPEEVGIVGVDDNNELNHHGIYITSVRQNFYEIGLRAAQYIVSKICDGKENDENVYIDTELIVKNSTP